MTRFGGMKKARWEKAGWMAGAARQRGRAVSEGGRSRCEQRADPEKPPDVLMEPYEL